MTNRFTGMLVAVALAMLCGCHASPKRPAGPMTHFTAHPDTATTDMYQPVEIDVLANDPPSPNNRDDVKLEKITTRPRHGRAALEERENSSGKKTEVIRYSPAGDFHGDDQLKYQATQGKESSEGVVTVHVRQRGSLQLHAIIDQREALYIRGDKVWFHHLFGEPPADVKINGKAFDPGFETGRDTNGGDSQQATIAPGFPVDKAYKVQASGTPKTWPAAQIVVHQEATPENNYT